MPKVSDYAIDAKYRQSDRRFKKPRLVKLKMVSMKKGDYVIPYKIYIDTQNAMYYYETIKYKKEVSIYNSCDMNYLCMFTGAYDMNGESLYDYDKVLLNGRELVIRWDDVKLEYRLSNGTKLDAVRSIRCKRLCNSLINK
jgi:hypothetical protein